MSSEKVESSKDLVLFDSKTFLKSDVSKSVAGFFAALLVGALIPRTIQYVVRRVVIKSIREVLILALAGWLTDRVAHLIVGSKGSTPAS